MAEAAAPEAALKRLQAWRECYCSYKGRMRNQDGLGRVWESGFRGECKGGPGGRGSCERRHGVGVNNGVKRGFEAGSYLNWQAFSGNRINLFLTFIETGCQSTN